MHFLEGLVPPSGLNASQHVLDHKRSSPSRLHAIGHAQLQIVDCLPEPGLLVFLSVGELSEVCSSLRGRMLPLAAAEKGTEEPQI